MESTLELEIRNFTSLDEDEWLKCHIAAYYESYFFDELVKIKPRYEAISLELVGIVNKEIVGILDIEIEEEAGQLSFQEAEKSGLISIIGIKPHYRRKNIATKLLQTAITLLKNEHTIHRLEIWVREDTTLLSWLEKNRFKEINRFYQVTLTTDFFLKYDIDLPFGLTPDILTANADSEGYSELSQYHAPEKTERIIIFEKPI